MAYPHEREQHGSDLRALVDNLSDRHGVLLEAYNEAVSRVKLLLLVLAIGMTSATGLATWALFDGPLDSAPPEPESESREVWQWCTDMCGEAGVSRYESQWAKCVCNRVSQ